MKNGERKKQEMQSTLSLSLSMSFAVSESQFLHELCDTRVRSFPFVKLNSQYDALKYLRQVKPINTQHLVYNTFLGWAREMVEFFNTQCYTNPDKKEYWGATTKLKAKTNGSLNFGWDSTLKMKCDAIKAFRILL